MTVADVAERTSNTVGTDGDGGALFDETAACYSRLRIRSEKIITDTLNSNVREALRAYRHMYVTRCEGLSVVSDVYFFCAAAILGRRSPGLPFQPQSMPSSRLRQSSTHFSRI
jgi:hypothetical protein